MTKSVLFPGASPVVDIYYKYKPLPSDPHSIFFSVLSCSTSNNREGLHHEVKCLLIAVQESTHTIPERIYTWEVHMKSETYPKSYC